MKKKLIAILFATSMVLSVTACGDSTETDTPNTQQTESSQQGEEKEEESQADSSAKEPTIELIAGEQGEYGTLITMSEGTDMEESFYVYYVPAGTYTITNEGEYMTQVSVYEGFTKNEDTGYDEYINKGDIKMIDSGKSETIEVPEGWFIEIQEPTHVSLVLTQSENTIPCISGSQVYDIIISLEDAGIPKADSVQTSDGWSFDSTTAEKAYSITTTSDHAICSAQFYVLNNVDDGYLGFCATLPYDDADPEKARAWVEDNWGEEAETQFGSALFKLELGTQGPILTIKAVGYDEYILNKLMNQ